LSEGGSIPTYSTADEYGYLGGNRTFNNFGVTRIPNESLLGIGDRPIGINFKMSDANPTHLNFLKANT
jgi:hypothetical protein